MRRGRDSVNTVVGREKRGNSTSIHAPCFLGGARPVAPLMPLPKGMNGPQLPFSAPGEQQHPHLLMLNPGDVPPRAEALPDALRRRDAALPKPVEWLPVASRIEIADNLVERGHVFTEIRARKPP